MTASHVVEFLHVDLESHGGILGRADDATQGAHQDSDEDQATQARGGCLWTGTLPGEVLGVGEPRQARRCTSDEAKCTKRQPEVPATLASIRATPHRIDASTNMAQTSISRPRRAVRTPLAIQATTTAPINADTSIPVVDDLAPRSPSTRTWSARQDHARTQAAVGTGSAGCAGCSVTRGPFLESSGHSSGRMSTTRGRGASAPRVFTDLGGASVSVEADTFAYGHVRADRVKRAPVETWARWRGPWLPACRRGGHACESVPWHQLGRKGPEDPLRECDDDETPVRGHNPFHRGVRHLARLNPGPVFEGVRAESEGDGRRSL